MSEPMNNIGALTTRGRQPLIGIPSWDGMDDVVHYFTSEADADQAVAAADDDSVARALGAIGGWSDLDFDEMLDALDEIRHRNAPTPPITTDI
jgi:hypothetical protein